MKKISQWSNRAINIFGIFCILAAVVSIIAIATTVEKYGYEKLDDTPKTSLTDSLEFGKAYVDTVGMLTLNPDAIIPHLEEPVDEFQEFTIWFYPVEGNLGKFTWLAPETGLLSYCTGYVHSRDVEDIHFNSGFPYIMMTI